MINGSPKEHGNTFLALSELLKTDILRKNSRFGLISSDKRRCSIAGIRIVQAAHDVLDRINRMHGSETIVIGAQQYTQKKWQRQGCD